MTLTEAKRPRKFYRRSASKLVKNCYVCLGECYSANSFICGQSPNPVTVPENGDWTRNTTGGKLMDPRGAEHWTLIFEKRDQKCAEDSARAFRDASQSLGMPLGNPQIMMLTADQNITYARSIAKAAVENEVIMSRTLGRSDRLRAFAQKIALQINCRLGGSIWHMAKMLTIRKIQ